MSCWRMPASPRWVILHKLYSAVPLKSAPGIANYYRSMRPRLPLSALLSHALVAFVIEFDNEFEHRTPHRTTTGPTASRAREKPWLVSMAMWTKLLRFVPPHGCTIAELRRASALPRNELKMLLIRLIKWWGYLTIDRAAPSPADWMVRPTPGGLKALESWRPLTAIVETRWQQRFGVDAIAALRDSLQGVANTGLPDSLPLLGYDLLSNPSPAAIPANPADLPALLSKTLLAFALEFESEAGLSLAIGSNILRLVPEEGIRVRDLPKKSGVAKAALAIALNRLYDWDLATLKPARLVVLTSKGRKSQVAATHLLRKIETRWQARFGKELIATLRAHLKSLTTHPALSDGIAPYPDGWRAYTPKPATLPHYPMILHRGGFPDGS